MITKAYSYIRFSTSEQMKGDSLRRQTKLSQQYAQSHNLELDTELNMSDFGVSAYKGANLSQGALGGFIEAVEAGAVKTGSYLLVENLDRLSRDDVQTALRLFLSILDMGIVIVTLGDGKKYEKGNITDLDLIVSLIYMSRAHDESKQKGRRIKAAWHEKRNNINTKKLTKWSPKWLRLSEDRSRFELIEERVKIVNDIFEWSAQGLGTSLIVKRLETEGIEPWSVAEQGMISKRTPKKWYISYIHKLLHNRAVLGEFRLKNDDHAEGYEVIQDYFPKIVSEELFYRVREARNARNINKAGKGAGRKGENYSNLFAGLAYCGYSFESNDGIHHCAGNKEPMIKVNKGKKYHYLQCIRLKDGNSGCDLCRKMWRYDYFETSFLSHVKDVDLSALVKTPNKFRMEIEEIEKAIASNKGKLSAIKEEKDKIVNLLSSKNAVAEVINSRLIKLEREQKSVESELDDDESTLVSKMHDYEQANVEAENLSNIIEQMGQLCGKELFDFRLKLSEIFKRSINKIQLFPRGAVKDEKFFDRERTKAHENAKVYAKVDADSQGIVDKKIIEEMELAYVEELTDIKLRHHEMTKGIFLPFFKVFYKSGETRTVTPDLKDPTKLDSTIKYGEGYVEMDFPRIGINDTINIE